MLSEEALIVLATLMASGLLVLGVMELVWPPKPRRAVVRRPRPAPAAPLPPMPREIADSSSVFRSLREPAPSVVEAPPVPAVVEEPPQVVEPPPPPPPPPPSAPAPVVAVAPLEPAPAKAVEPPPLPAPRRGSPAARAGRAPRAVEWRAEGVPVIGGDVELRPPRVGSPEPEPSPQPAPAAAPPELAPVAAREEAVVPPPVPPSPPAPAETAPRREAKPSVLPIDTCLTMYRERRFAEVVSLGSAALEVNARMAPVSERHDEAAALYDLVGLSKQELGDRDGARAAFAAAVRGAEAAVRPTYVRHLLTLLRGTVDPITAGTAGTDEAAQVRELRAWTVALDEAIKAVPGDEALTPAIASVREALSPACERLVARVVSGEGDDRAREIVLEALSDEAMPPAWREGLRDQLTSASSAEIGQLTAQAIRSVQDGKDVEALAALERAERLSGALPSGAVADDRREEFERRLWWGYTKVGLRRVDTKKFEDALEPLFRALKLGGIDEERLSETRSALVRALDGYVDAKWPALQKLGNENPARAQAEVEKLWAMLRDSIDRGINQDDLSDALAKVMHLGQTLPRT
jgi:hypothetical protein